MLPAFQRDNPQVAVEAVVRRGSHPGLQADYRECRLQLAQGCQEGWGSACLAGRAPDSSAAREPQLGIPPGHPHADGCRRLELGSDAVQHPAAAGRPAIPRPSLLARPQPLPAVNTTGRHVDLRNQPAEEVLRQAVYLRSSLGRKASLQARWGGSRVAGGLLATGLAVAVPHNFDVVSSSAVGWTARLLARVRRQVLQRARGCGRPARWCRRGRSLSRALPRPAPTPSRRSSSGCGARRPASRGPGATRCRRRSSGRRRPRSARRPLLGWQACGPCSTQHPLVT